MKIAEIVSEIERYAPLHLQESYDNAGLIVGSADDEVTCALLCVDITEEVMDEAEECGGAADPPAAADSRSETDTAGSPPADTPAAAAGPPGGSGTALGYGAVPGSAVPAFCRG